MLAHIVAIFFPIIGPLVIWLVKKDSMPFVNSQGKEALNFQITMLIAAVVLIVTIIGIILLPVLGIANLVLSLIAGLKAHEGKDYRYPFALRLIK